MWSPASTSTCLGRCETMRSMFWCTASAVPDVLDQRLRLVLRENGDLADPGVHAVRQHEFDEAELAAEGRRRFAAMRGQITQPLAAPASHDDGERAARQAAHITSGRSACGLAGHETYYTARRSVSATLK